MSWIDTLPTERQILKSDRDASGKIVWRSPSNIALVKYWGKHGVQLPSNPSLSFTLTNAYTQTSLAYERKGGTDKSIDLTFTFDRSPKPAFAERVKKYMEGLIDVFPFLGQLSLRIDSSNSFPHSSGIASSASSMSALALCLCTLEHQLFGSLGDDTLYRRKASYLARLGSGSACRSIYPQAALWGKTLEIPEAHDEYAVPMTDNMHPVFKDYRDAILIVSSEEKKVSSSIGHSLMVDHPYKTQRFTQAKQHLSMLLQVLQEGNTEQFVEIVESEALTLHALMMSSTKSFMLLKPGTLEIIEKIRAFRQDTGIPVCFTLDAGPNVHVLYPRQNEDAVKAFIQTSLLEHCQGKYWIDDHCGPGPEQID